MTEFVDVEWFGRDTKVGIVLTHDEFDGFKARMAPLPFEYVYASERAGVDWMMQNAAKIPFEWAWGIFKEQMLIDWRIRNPGVDVTQAVIRYDHHTYKASTGELVK